MIIETEQEGKDHWTFIFNILNNTMNHNFDIILLDLKI